MQHWSRGNVASSKRNIFLTHLYVAWVAGAEPLKYFGLWFMSNKTSANACLNTNFCAVASWRTLNTHALYRSRKRSSA